MIRRPYKNKPFVNPQDFPIDDFFNNKNLQGGKANLTLRSNNCSYFDDILDGPTLDFLMTELTERYWIPVGVDGFKENHKEGDKIGSYRLSLYSENLANYIWERVSSYYDHIEFLGDMANNENDGHTDWKAIGVNPLFRFIKYTDNGTLIPHYDSPYVKNTQTRTLKSFVIYLTSGEDGGTRFLVDPQNGLKVEDRDFSDQFFTPKDNDVLQTARQKQNSGVIFDHRILHDSEPNKNEKIIIRTDIVYEKV